MAGAVVAAAAGSLPARFARRPCATTVSVTVEPGSGTPGGC